MGTKLGNIHIRNASPEEVSALLPDALVSQWGEEFVSAYHEDYQLGMVERAGQRLSRKLPAATVLTAAVFDDDMAAFAVFQAGKRLTYHLLDPYEGQNKAGNPKVFCEALGLPTEDEKRLKVIWKKGDACEQMELTGALLGLPLWADTEWQPKEKPVRNTEMVDAWIADHPDPPKIKSVTKAELVQELSQIQMNASSSHRLIGTNFFYGTEDANRLWSDGYLYRTGETGLLELVEKIEAPEAAIHLLREYFPVASDRVWGIETLFRYTNGVSSEKSWQLFFDSQGSAPALKGEGYLSHCKMLPDGGAWLTVSDGTDKGTQLNCFHGNGTLRWTKLLDVGESVIALTAERVYTKRSEPSPDRSKLGVFHFSCYDVDGTLCGARTLPWNSDLIKVDPNGDLWRREDLGRRLLHLDKDLNLLAHSDVFDIEHGVLNVTRSPDGETVLCTVFEEGIWVLNGADLSLRQVLRSKEVVGEPTIDGAGRFWALVGDSTVAAYDQDLRTISRHRLKGSVTSLRCNEAGELMAYTMDDKRALFRVYRIS